MNGVGKGSSRWSVVIANAVRSGFRGHDARSLVYVAVGFRTGINVPRGTMVYGEVVVLGLIVMLVGVQGLGMYMRIVM